MADAERHRRVHRREIVVDRLSASERTELTKPALDPGSHPGVGRFRFPVIDDVEPEERPAPAEAPDAGALRLQPARSGIGSVFP